MKMNASPMKITIGKIMIFAKNPFFKIFRIVTTVGRKNGSSEATVLIAGHSERRDDKS